MAEDLFSEGSDIVSVGIYKSQSQQPVRTFTQQKFLETYGFDEQFFNTLIAENPIPFTNILRQGEDMWNASVKKGPPLIGYGRLVVVQDRAGHPIEQWAVVGFVKLDRFLKAVSIVHLSQIYVANRRGEVLVQPDAKGLLDHPRSDRDPIFREAMEAKAKISLINRELEDGRVLAAFGKGYNDQLFVIAKASEGEVFQVVKDFITRTLLFGSIVLTLVILAAFLLSRSLTENIALLVERMESVRGGDLTTTIQLKGRDETITLAQTFNQMIHDLKDSRDALEGMNRELDQKVKERTAQLEEQHQKVKDVQEALIRTTRLASVGEIAGRTAHEVLNPLTILLTRVGLMQKRVTTSQTEQLGLMDEIRQAWSKDFKDGGFESLVKNWKSPSEILPKTNLFQEDLQNLEKVAGELRDQNKNIGNDILFIKAEAERIGKIINAMRRLGNSKSEAKPQSVHAILSDCCYIMADLFEQRSFDLQRDFQAAQFMSVVDRDELIQAVTNLMRNSLQALEDEKNSKSAGEKKMGMAIRTRNDGANIVIDIEDNGIGITPENQVRLFESSFTTKKLEDGTGLGLGISRRFVRGYGGDIEFVSSEPGRKTVFRIRLPLEHQQEKQGAVA
jgi:signal transduction histidine kinase